VEIWCINFFALVGAKESQAEIPIKTLLDIEKEEKKRIKQTTNVTPKS